MTGRSVGSVADTARLPGVHPQWLFFFPVADLEASLEKVRAAGGIALAPFRTSNGHRAVACDDPQRAAFGLWGLRE